MRKLGQPRQNRLIHDTRGATMVEYCFLLTLVVLAAAPMMRAIGEKAHVAFVAASITFGE